jgi:predicted MFS family arabinose efflux permease
MATTDTAPTPGTQHEGPDPKRYWSLAVIALAQLMIVLDASVVIVALPSAQRALHISVANRQWVMSSYTLAFGSLLLLGGRIADYLGRRRMFIVGLIGFGTASALGGLAQNAAMLFGARALQGAFAAVMAPAALCPSSPPPSPRHTSVPAPSACMAPSPAGERPSASSSGGP